MIGPSELLLALVSLVGVAAGVWAFVDSLVRPAAAYVAAGKLTKPAWNAITAVSALALLFSGVLGLFGLVGLVAAIVYLVDVRPAVREMRPGGPWG